MVASKMKVGRPKVPRRTTKYANAPLAEVVFEVRFPGEPAVECRRHEFFDTVRDEFPTVWVPGVEPGQPVALQPYRFKANESNDMVMVALNRFAYSTQNYPGFEKFQPSVSKLTKAFCRMFRIKKLNRTGLRYVNVIPFLREDGLIPWHRFFTSNLSLPGITPNEFINVGLSYESPCAGGVLTTRIACAKRAAENNREVFLLDFDFAMNEALVIDKLDVYLEESHTQTKRVFEAIIAESYKSVMRGEVIE